MDVIREEHVAELLRTEEPEPVLVVCRGTAEVVPRSRLGDPEYRGALQVVSRGELEAGTATRDAAVLARRLNETVSAMGG